MSLAERAIGFARHHAAVAALKALPRPRIIRSVLLAGSGRSGTTWLADLINHQRDYRIVFEPFHPEYVKAFSHFKSRQYLRPGHDDPTAAGALQKLLNGVISNRWTNSRVNSFFCDKLLIKEIRGNLLLPWIRQQAPDTKFVLLIRHPSAVITSRMKLGWGAETTLFTSQEDLVSDYLQPFSDAICKAGSEVEKQIIFWCIENYIPLKHFDRQDLYVCYYENLVLDPQGEMDRLMDYLGESRSEIPRHKFGKASDTNFNRTDHDDPLGTRPAGKKADEAQGRQIREIMQAFGMGSLYHDDGRPGFPELTQPGL